MGNPSFAMPSLEKLINEKHEILAVVTNPDKPAGRGRELKSPPVKSLADRLGMRVFQPHQLSDEGFSKSLESLHPELFTVVAFRILPSRLLQIPSVGSVNLHASLLPKYRGAAPINWAIINGEKVTGVTTFFLKPKVDTGDILMQQECPIGAETTFGDLYGTLSEMGAELLCETVKAIADGKAQPRAQIDSAATSAPKITPETGRIDFGNSCEKMVNLVRGLSPRPGAFAYFRGNKVKILRAAGAGGGEWRCCPGEIVLGSEKRGLSVSCMDGMVEILTIQPEGKRAMNALEFINGYHPVQGELMGDRAH